MGSIPTTSSSTRAYATKVIAHKASSSSSLVVVNMSLTERSTVEDGNGNSLPSEGFIW